MQQVSIIQCFLLRKKEQVVVFKESKKRSIKRAYFVHSTLIAAHTFLSSDEEQRLRNAALARDLAIKADRDRANQWRKKRGYELYQNMNHFTFADYLHPMLLLSINTGLRRDEIFSLKWENVSIAQTLLTIEGSYSKSGKTRHIPLNSEAVSVLKTWRQQTNSNDLVFHNKDGLRFDNIKKGWATI
jgi:integrase